MSIETSGNSRTSTRRAGVLLHITSLPNELGKKGRLDQNAWRFVDWLAEAKLSTWQFLPLNHPHSDGSPYNSVSAFAMNPAFLPEDWQAQLDTQGYREFLKDEPFWLHDYALFIVLKQQHQQQCWSDWPEEFKSREPQALKAFTAANAESIDDLKQQQFFLLSQWNDLKTYANQKGIEFFGDIPIFVSYDSADVWAYSQEFLLNEDFLPPVVTGVPPDYFSETGQRWGNPHYDWQHMEKDGFQWWLKRIGHSLALFDLVRIDHFRGLQASWVIDAAEETAINGYWKEVPGEALLQAVKEQYPDMPIVAEDLGLITPEVVALKEGFELPGMSVLQFGFNGLPDNPHALNEQVENSVAYTGTHDNDTSLGWFNTLDDSAKNWVMECLGQYEADVKEVLPNLNEMPWPLIIAGMHSVAQRLVVPMQDFLMLDSEHRMNVPGIADGNWGWQFQWTDVPTHLVMQIAQLVQHGQRINFIQHTN